MSGQTSSLALLLAPLHDELRDFIAASCQLLEAREELVGREVLLNGGGDE